MRYKTILILLFCCLVLSLSATEIKVTSSVNSKKLGINDQVKYSIKIVSDEDIRIEEPRLPTIENLVFRNVFSSTSFMTRIVNFKSSKSYTKEFTYVLLPSKPGKVMIPQIVVKAGNRSFTLDPIEIEISSSPSKTPAPQQRSNPFDPFGSPGFDTWGFNERSGGETFLIAIPEKTSAWLGEPLVVSYYVYTEQGVTSLNLLEEKDFEGYGKEIFEQPTMLEFEEASFKGRRYKRSLIKRIALSPNNAGRIRAPHIAATVRLFDFGYSSKTIASQELYFEVKALPEVGKPSSFGGAIGSFQVRETMGETDISLGEAINFSLQISGKGNFNQFIAPQFESIPNIQVSAPLVSDNLNAGVEGKRNLYYTIIPQEKGEYQLPILEFSWFDPGSGSYRIFRSTATKINVKPGNVFSYFTNFFQKERVSKLNPLQKVDKYKQTIIYLQSPWYWLLFFVLILSLMVSWYFSTLRKMRYRDPIGWSDFQAQRILRKYLKDAKQAAQSVSTDFYPLAEKGLMRYLAEKYKISNRLSIAEKLQAMEDRQIPPQLISELQDFLDHCQRARFMPGGFDSNRLKEDLDALTMLIGNFVKFKNNIVSAIDVAVSHPNVSNTIFSPQTKENSNESW